MKHSTWMLIAAVIILLASATFVGARMLRSQAKPVSASGGPKFIISGPGGTREISIVRSAELPQEDPALRGLFLRHVDSGIMAGTGKFQINLRNGEIATSHDGPEVEVVVTHATKVYHDKTSFEADNAVGNEIQQELEPGSLDEIEDNAMISAWGEKRGDRFFADILVYTQVGT